MVCMIQSCKENTTTQKEETTEVPNQEPARNSASTITGGHEETFLTDGILQFKASNTIGKTEDMFAGQWVDLMPDGTYKAGKGKDQTHTGKWDYSVDKKIIVLRPDDQTLKMSEWNVMYNGEMMVWVGTQTYGNNASQIQIVRAEQLPD